MEKIDLACIIEDDPIHLFLTQKAVLASGKFASILICNNGKEAFDKLSAIIKSGEQLPSLILLDLNMPIWDGWKFLDEFTKIPIEKIITIYILTSSTSTEDLQKASEYGLNSNYIVKPITHEKLKTILENFN